MRVHALCALVLPLATVVLPPHASAQKNPIGSEFQVNTFTAGVQKYAAVATDPEGDFVVVWQSARDGDASGIFGQRYSSAAVPLDAEFQINSSTTGNQYYPAVASDAEGDFIVAWHDSTLDGSGLGVFARRYSSSGDPIGSVLQVNTYVTGTQAAPSIAADPDGDFVIAWESDSASAGREIVARRFSSSGAPVTAEILVNTVTAGSQQSASSSASVNGDFVVAWQSADGSEAGVFARIFSSTGVPITGEIQVNTYTENKQSNATVRVDGEGDFVIVWHSLGQDGYLYGIRARRFSSAGVPVGGELQVSAFTNRSDAQASMAIDGSGDFVVAWHDAVNNNILARRFSSAGIAQTSDFLVNTYTPNVQGFAAVAARFDGNFVVAWESYRDGDQFGIFAQRFAALATLDIDGNGSLEARTDGILVLRRFFGFNGPTLTDDAIGEGCTRCDADAIEPYIAQLGLILDIDGDGTLRPLTDGILIVRDLFGFGDPALTNGATDESCTRCDAAAIEPYLDGLS